MNKQAEIQKLNDLYKIALDEKNYELAFDYCKQSALLGSVPATYLLGRLYLSGKDISIELTMTLKTAMTCFTLAADCGFEPAEKIIAEIYSDYRILSEKILGYDGDKAEKLYSLGTEIIYECDIGETPDYKKAFEYFSEAAKLFHSSAMEELGDLYRNGYGVDKDEKKAAQWFARATRFKFYQEEQDLYQLSEDMREGLKLGKILQVEDSVWVSDIRRSLGLSDEYSSSFNPLVKSAEFGNADSILELGRVCDEDSEPLGIYCIDLKKVVKPDKKRAERLYKRAFRCYKEAVEAGDYWSVYGLIGIYRDGLVNGLNMNDEIDFLKKCADFCDNHSLKKDVWNAIGEIYRDGLGGVERNPQKADEYFTKAESWKITNE